MTRWATRAVVVAGAVVFGLLVVLTPSPAAAEPADAVGWWTRRPGAAPLGAGAFELAAGLQGEESVAAVRVGALPAGTTAARLVITEAPGADPDTAFRACRAGSAWEPADGGAWDLRAVADCTTAVDAARAGTGRWAVELGPFLGVTPVEVVLVPVAAAAVPGLGPPIGFATAFSGVDVVVSTPTAAAPPQPTPRPSPSPPPSPASAAPSPSVATVPSPAPGAVSPATTTPPSATDPADVGVAAPIEAPMFELSGDDGDDRPWGRLLLLVPLSAVVGLTAAVGRNLTRDGSLASALHVVQPWRQRTGRAAP